MPKKFKGGENSKAVEARTRKAAIHEAEQDLQKKKAEDAYWQDDDKHASRKEHRKDDKEKKRLEQLEKKRENQQMYADDMAAVKSAKPSPPSKVTRAQIEAQQQLTRAEAAAAKKKGEIPYDERMIEENINRLDIDDGARTVDEAISTLSDRPAASEVHPEKRMKAAFTEFESNNLERLKTEHPTLRLSQVKQLLKKEWMKSPDNPMNQRQAAYLAQRK